MTKIVKAYSLDEDVVEKLEQLLPSDTRTRSDWVNYQLRQKLGLNRNRISLAGVNQIAYDINKVQKKSNENMKRIFNKKPGEKL